MDEVDIPAMLEDGDERLRWKQGIVDSEGREGAGFWERVGGTAHDVAAEVTSGGDAQTPTFNQAEINQYMQEARDAAHAAGLDDEFSEAVAPPTGSYQPVQAQVQPEITAPAFAPTQNTGFFEQDTVLDGSLGTVEQDIASAQAEVARQARQAEQDRQAAAEKAAQDAAAASMDNQAYRTNEGGLAKADQPHMTPEGQVSVDASMSEYNSRLSEYESKLAVFNESLAAYDPKTGTKEQYDALNRAANELESEKLEVVASYEQVNAIIASETAQVQGQYNADVAKSQEAMAQYNQNLAKTYEQMGLDPEKVTPEQLTAIIGHNSQQAIGQYNRDLASAYEQMGLDRRRYRPNNSTP